MSDLDLYADSPTGQLVSSDGSTPIVPPLFLGDTVRCKLHVLDRAEDGVTIRERDLQIRSIWATLGKILTPPTSGKFKLDVDGTITGEIDFDEAAADLLVLLGVVAISVEKSETGCWIAKMTQGGSPFPLAAADDSVAGYNTLVPESFVRVRAFQRNTIWYHEIRLIQAPLAANDADGADFERVLPPAPSVTTTREGAYGSDEVPEVNELQDIYFPPDFRGTYILHWGLYATRELGLADGPTEIADALNAMFGDTAERFAVDNTRTDHEVVEFIGPLAGAPHDAITVSVVSFPPGVPTFDLPLDRASMCDALRTEAAITRPLEIEVEIVKDDEDPEDLEIPGRFLTLFQQDFVIKREQRWKEMNTVRRIDWLRIPSAKDYVAVTADQILFATPGFKQAIGDGATTSFVLTHALDTRDGVVVVMENNPGGRVLGSPGEFSYSFPSNAAIALEFAVAPAEDGLVVIFMALGDGAYFQAHTHTIGQIVGLQDALDALATQITALQSIVGVTGFAPADTTISGEELKVIVPDWKPAPLPPYESIALGEQQTFALFHPLPIAFASTIGSGTITGDLAPTGTVGNRCTVTTSARANETAGREAQYFAAGEIITWNGRFWQPIVPAPPITTIASVDTGAETITTAAAHALAENDLVRFSTSSALPGGLSANDNYFVLASGLTGTVFKVSATSGGSAVNLTSAGTGTHTVQRAAWYPAEFEETILQVAINDQQLAAGARFTVAFTPRLQLLTSPVASERTTGLVRLFFEHAQRTSTAGGHLNIEDLTWLTVASVDINLAAAAEEHPFVFAVNRSGAGTLTAYVKKYLQAAATVTAPASANLVFRARLGFFDPENRTNPAGSFVRECKDIEAGFAAL